MANSFIILQFTDIFRKNLRWNNLKSKFVGNRDFVANWNYAFVVSMFYNSIDEGEPVQAIWHRIIINMEWNNSVL